MPAPADHPPRSSLDEIIELYKRGVDVTLIDAALERTVEERILALEEFERFREELRAATERQRDRPHDPQRDTVHCDKVQ